MSVRWNAKKLTKSLKKTMDDKHKRLSKKAANIMNKELTAIRREVADDVIVQTKLKRKIVNDRLIQSRASYKKLEVKLTPIFGDKLKMTDYKWSASRGAKAVIRLLSPIYSNVKLRTGHLTKDGRNILIAVKDENRRKRVAPLGRTVPRIFSDNKYVKKAGDLKARILRALMREA